MEHGDLVSLSDSPNPKSDDPMAPFLLEKSQRPYDQRLMGVVSSFAGDTKNYGFYQPIALVGRVPAKVSTENGPIAKGDPITSSSIPGVGMKATKPGRVIGIAFEPYNGGGVGKIMIFVDRTWYLPQEAKQDAKISKEEKDNLEPLIKAPAEVIEKLPDFVRNTGLKIKDKAVEFKEIFIEKLSALEIITERLKAKNVETETITSDWMQLRDRATGDIYCTWIENSQWQIIKGECSTLSTTPQTPRLAPSSSVIELQPPLRGRGREEGRIPSSLKPTSTKPTSTPEVPPGQQKREEKPQSQQQPEQVQSLLGSIIQALQNLLNR